MTERTGKTRWLDLVEDRAELGRTIERLSRLAVAAHLAAHASGAGAARPALPAMDRLRRAEVSP